MDNVKQVVLQEKEQATSPAQTEKTQADRVELFLRKIVLAALTMLGIGYILVNVPIAFLIGNSVLSIPINSQASISAISGRILFLIASIISALLGGLFIFGAVSFYERRQTKGIVFLGVLMGSFYLICLGVGASLLLSETSLTSLLLTVAPILVAVSAATCTSLYTRVRLAGFVFGVVGGVLLAYAIFNLSTLSLVFAWGIPFTGPFMSLTVLESVVVVLAPGAAFAYSLFGHGIEERPLAHVFVVLVGLIYGVAALIGSLVLSMSFWNLIWKSPWVGPLHGLSEWALSMVVFWSASLVLVDVGGVLLVVAACLGFFYVAQEFAQL